MLFLRFRLFLGLNFSFWFSDVYSQMSFVNICLKYITFREILQDKIFLFVDPMNISWIRFKIVVLYGVKQTDDIVGYGKKQTILVFFIRRITVVFVIKNQLFLKLWIFQLLVKVHSFPRQQTILKCVIVLGILSLSLEYK